MLHWRRLRSRNGSGNNYHRCHRIAGAVGRIHVQPACKGYAAHENNVLTQVTQARARVVAAASDPSTTMAQRVAAENELSRSLINLQATAEAYPQLQANQNFMDLQGRLGQLEEKIAFARQFYNDVVMKYNTSTETVPTNIIAGLFRFEQAQYFEADEASREAPKVKF